MANALVNRVEKSGLITLDLNDLLPAESIEVFDLKDFLVKELVLMEKPFRESLKEVDWKKFQDKFVGIYCSTDAIIPKWAYMLVTTYLEPFAQRIFYGNNQEVKSVLLEEAIGNINPEDYREAKIVIKGCGEDIPTSAYIAITRKLKPVTSSLMYGEPCSTVPVYKKTKNAKQ